MGFLLVIIGWSEGADSYVTYQRKERALPWWCYTDLIQGLVSLNLIESDKWYIFVSVDR